MIKQIFYTFYLQVHQHYAGWIHKGEINPLKPIIRALMESICHKYDGILNQGRVKNKKFLVLSQPEYWVYFYICNSHKEEIYY